ncbi:hypothetical protein FQN52_000859 [Onygenales sp. PD_12]|nr:hypothetical protein FQN52_000859 [Onygenales sp. PD_12]
MPNDYGTMQDEGLGIDPAYAFSLQNGQEDDFPVLKPDNSLVPFYPGFTRTNKLKMVTKFTDMGTITSTTSKMRITEFTPVNFYPPSFPASPQYRHLTPANPPCPYPTGSNTPLLNPVCQHFFNPNPNDASWPVTPEPGQQFTDGSTGMGEEAGYGLEGFSLSTPIYQDGTQNVPLAEGQHTDHSLCWPAFAPEKMPEISLQGLTISDPNLLNAHLSEENTGQRSRRDDSTKQDCDQPGYSVTEHQGSLDTTLCDLEEGYDHGYYALGDAMYLEQSVMDSSCIDYTYPQDHEVAIPMPSEYEGVDDLDDIPLESPAPPYQTMESDPLESSPKIKRECSSSATPTPRNHEFDFHEGSY